jgi:hypothetical protein
LRRFSTDLFLLCAKTYCEDNSIECSRLMFISMSDKWISEGRISRGECKFPRLPRVSGV